MRYFLTFLLLAGFAAVAAAQLRSIPKDAQRAQMRYLYGTTLAIDGRERRLAPGGQIRDASNRIVVPSAVAGPVLVKYLNDPDGFVRQVWILTPEEAAQKGQ
jgi:hypothetical protein